MVRLALAVLVALPACVPAPADPAGDLATSNPPQSLEEARALWTRAGLDDYSYTIARSCFCPPEATGPFEVTVRDGRIVGVTRAGAAVEAAEVQLPTVPDLFDQIEEAYAAGAAEVRVEYDASLGYPTELWIDLERMMADEEIGYTVTGLARE